MNRKFDLEDRFVNYAASVMSFAEGLRRSYANDYLAKQLIRSSGGAALNFAEMQGAVSDKDYIIKGNLSFKELKESELNLKILKLREDDSPLTDQLLGETIELIKILRTLINKRKANL